MKNILSLSFFLSVIFLNSCKQSSSNFLPEVKGEANDIIVVMSGPKWDAAPGEIVREFIAEPLQGLPMDEPKFDYLFVPHSNFDKVYRRQRNIMITKIGPDYKERVLVKEDAWAKSQLTITITAPSSEAFVELYKKKGKEINEIVATYELKRLRNAFKANPEKNIIEILKKEHHVKLDIPKGYKVNLDSSGFVWLRNEYREIIEGVLIYYYPYSDSNTFSKEYLLRKRNSILKKYVPGELEGSYMATEERFNLESYEYELDGNRYTKELRGLWKIKNGLAMGGPFVSITQYDEERKRIVTVEGFIFAPGHDKRNLVRRVEAIVYSMDFETRTE